MIKFLAILGCILLLPSVLYFLEFAVTVLSTSQQLFLFGLPNDPKILAGSLSSMLVTQMLSVVILVPGIIIVSIASLKYNAGESAFFRKYLSFYAVIQLLTFPVISLIGGYLFWLKKRGVPMRTKQSK